MAALIETERLRLAPLRVADAAEMVAVFADPSLYAFIGGTPPTFVELEERFFQWEGGSPRKGEAWHNWIVRLRDGGAAIGHVQATVIEGGRTADVAWVIGTAWQGRGYASEAARALVAWLEAAGIATITAHVAAGHEASNRAAAAAGLFRTQEIEGGEVVWRRQAATPSARG